jgi:hypothetical protein
MLVCVLLWDFRMIWICVSVNCWVSVYGSFILDRWDGG